MGLPPRERDPIERIALRPTEAAVAIGVTTRTIYRMMDRGDLRSYQVGGVRLIRLSDVKALVGENEPATRDEMLSAGVVEREAMEHAAYVRMFGKRWRCVPRGERVECDPHPLDPGRA